ncbi:MAG: hypothetical protein IPK64_13220 [bacterium]|nr:hypothetical protein [bacterium]
MADPAVASPPPTSPPAASGSWFTRTLHRYFSNDAPAGTELGGQVVALSERYAAYADRRIAVVIVQQVDRLRPDDASERELMSSLARTLRPYTREGVLRQYLLFRQGELLDPLDLADTERLLRGIEYVADVRLHVVPLTGQEEEVAVVVEIRDRLPVGARLSTRGVDRVDAGLFHANVAGLDVRLAADLRYRREVTPETGWGGELRKRNMGGSFIDAEFAYEDSWRGLDRRSSLVRAEAHPDIRWVGGLAWRDRLEREDEPSGVRTVTADGWAGRVIRLRTDVAGDSRAVLVPAGGWALLDLAERPSVRPDSNFAFHGNRQLLAGLTWSRSQDYRTSFLHGLGQIENLSGGQGLKLSTAYVDGEFRDRTGLFLQGWRQVVRGRGDVLGLGLDLGGYLRAHRLEDGSLRLAVHYVSPLLGAGGWRSRLLAGARFHRAVRSTGGGPLTLAGGLGPRELDLSAPGGDRRLVMDLEWRFYPNWVVSGFRCQAYGFADGALLAGDDRALSDGRLLGSAGLGLRIGNPDLVLPVLQVQVAFLRGMDDNAAMVLVSAGSFTAPETRLPGARPGAYEFR